MEEESIGRRQSQDINRAIIVTIEGLGCNLMGAYGSAISPTPNWDQFASQGIVADQFWMDSPSTIDILDSFWTGTHRVDTSRRRENSHAPHEDRSQPAFATPGLFVTDCEEAFTLAQQRLQGEQALFMPRESEGLAFEQLLTFALEVWIQHFDEWPWLWIHSRGLNAAWDAPYEYRLRMCDEGDPDPPRAIEPPFVELPENADPDIAFGWSCGAGAQAIAMDESWRWIDRCLDELSIAERCLVVLAGVHGYPLGEHGVIGSRRTRKGGLRYPVDSPNGDPLSPAGDDLGVDVYAERLHCPLILRPGAHVDLGRRFSQFIQPQHLLHWIDTWLQDRPADDTDEVECDYPSNEPDSVNDRVKLDWDPVASFWECGMARDQWPAPLRSALALGDKDVALMLPSWSSRWTWTRNDATENDRLDAMGVGSERADVHSAAHIALENILHPNLHRGDGWILQGLELYVLPDDRWQQNEVSDRAAAVVESMLPILRAWLECSEDRSEQLEELLGKMNGILLDTVR